jgi:hypothetical protein
MAVTRTVKAERLLAYCEAFIKEQEISCSDSVYQSDRVILNAYDFIAGVCNIAGYHEIEEEDF